MVSIVARRRILKGVLGCTVPILTQVTVIGRDRIPSDPVLVASNHLSFLDPAILFYILPDPPEFMAAANLSRSAYRPAVYYYAPLLVHRNRVDVAGVRANLEALRRRQWLVIFPEGGISQGRTLR